MSGYRGPYVGDGSIFVGQKTGLVYAPSLMNLFGKTTRFYLHNTLASPISPAVSASWTDTNELLRRRGTPLQDFDAIADGTTIDWTAGALAIDRQYVFGPMVGGTLQGTVKCQIRSRELAGADNVFPRSGLRVVSNDGSVVRGTLLAVASNGTGTELVAGAGLTNRTWMNGNAVGPLAVLDGDWLVLEIGYTDVAGTTPAALSSWGSTATIDLPENDTTQAVLRPWFQLVAA